MNNYIYNNQLIGKKQLKNLLSWSFTNYNSIEACALADELKHLGFKYATKAGMSISIEDLKVPFIKNQMLQAANREILNAEKICLKGKITDVERFQKIIDSWSITSESLKNEVISYFKNYEPLNSVYIMAFSGARGNVSQVRQLVGMRGLMADPSGAILKLPIKKNFREGLTITDYLMSAYGARKGIVDTALKTANSGYLTRRLIDVAQDILIREKDCFTNYSYLIIEQKIETVTKRILGRLLSKPVYTPNGQKLVANKNAQITLELINIFKTYKIQKLYIRSPLTCKLYRSICQRCYGWDITKENLIDFGEAVGIIAGQSIGEPGTQLTMRTFHTGGIFTAEVSQQIKSPINGLIKFSKVLKTTVLRTNKGESVLVTKNSGSLIIVPEKKDLNLKQIEVLRNTILFVKNNQYIKEGNIIGELSTNKKQIRTEIVPIVSSNAGQILIPRLKKQAEMVAKNKLLWLLFGQLYKGPKNSFLNFYSDYKINKSNYIFRTKVITPFSGFINIKKENNNLFQQVLEITSKKQLNIIGSIKKWEINLHNQIYVLIFQNLKYLLNNKKQISKKYFGSLLTNKFRTITGGIVHYLNPINWLFNTKLYYYKINDPHTFKYLLQDIIFLADIVSIIEERVNNSFNVENFNLTWKKQLFNSWNNIYSTNYQTNNFIKINNALIWLNEETYDLNCNKTMLLVEDGNFISKNFEIFPRLFSKTEGIIHLQQNNNIVKSLSIKSGSLYNSENRNNFSRKIYFPGEMIAKDIPIKQLSFCENVSMKELNKLLLRPLELYEIPSSKSVKKIIKNNSEVINNFELTSNNRYLYKPNQKIKRNNSINLNLNVLKIKSFEISNNNLEIKILTNLKKQVLNILIRKKVFLNHYIPPNLKSTNIQNCLITEDKQFLNRYVTFSYFESTIPKSLKIVKLKTKSSDYKQIFLISNEDCLIVKKSLIGNKKINELFISKQNIQFSGRVIIDNGKMVTIQKGRPYFFPNCTDDEQILNQSIKYKIFSQVNKKFNKFFSQNRSIHLKYYDITKKHLIRKYLSNTSSFSISKDFSIGMKFEFSKMFIQKNNKIYIKRIPILSKLTSISNQYDNINYFSKLKMNFELGLLKKQNKQNKPKKLYVFFKNSKLSSNYIRKPFNSQTNIILFQNIASPFQNSINIYPITEDYFETESNTVFCKNNQFVENGQILGLLNFEKEITGDIVQGLPRIEQLFEARKVTLTHKLIPTSKKKHLLIQTSSIDSSFEFRKLGTTIKENEKINPHNLLKIYFNYYGSRKRFLCDRTKTLISARLMTNYDAAYRTFKKVQGLILNLIQSVYKSQGVSIIDKHFEVIIKQMTTKVLITHEGSTPLLPTEIVDLYHIAYINKIIKSNNKQTAYYVPILFGITKAALNNPSFTSAASFQETTRVLTKAAIEGRLDWLRGLKENIIIGRLIPAGTGSPTYRNCFKKKFIKPAKANLHLKTL